MTTEADGRDETRPAAGALCASCGHRAPRHLHGCPEDVDWRARAEAAEAEAKRLTDAHWRAVERASAYVYTKDCALALADESGLLAAAVARAEAAEERARKAEERHRYTPAALEQHARAEALFEAAEVCDDALSASEAGVAIRARALEAQSGASGSSWRQRAERAEALLKQREADAAAAAGECLVPVPEPGTDMARLLSANRLLKAENAHEREAADRNLKRAETAERERDEARRERDEARREAAGACVYCNAKVIGRAARSGCGRPADGPGCMESCLCGALVVRRWVKDRSLAEALFEMGLPDALPQAKADLSSASARAYEAESDRDTLRAKLAAWRPVVEAAVRQESARPGDGPALTPEQRGHTDPAHLAMLAEKYPWLRATVDVEAAAHALPPEARP